MNNDTETKPCCSTSTEKEKKPGGFFSRVFQKLDDSMKQKADERAQQSCCGGDQGKGGKCC